MHFVTNVVYIKSM